MNVEEQMNEFKKQLHNRLQIHFTDDCDMYDIDVKTESVDKILVKDDILKVHDVCENAWHCYNMKFIKHFYVPGGIKLSWIYQI